MNPGELPKDQKVHSEWCNRRNGAGSCNCSAGATASMNVVVTSNPQCDCGPYDCRRQQSFYEHKARWDAEIERLTRELASSREALRISEMRVRELSDSTVTVARLRAALTAEREAAREKVRALDKILDATADEPKTGMPPETCEFSDSGTHECKHCDALFGPAVNPKASFCSSDGRGDQPAIIRVNS